MGSAPPVTEATARTWVDVDLERIAANLASLRQRLPPDTDILLPVKANAYGHGLVPVARAARRAGVWGLAVATVAEAEGLRAAGDEGPVLCLMPILPAEAARALALDVTASVSTPEQAAALAAAAREAGRSAAVHVEVDTGMGRTGVALRDAAEFVARLAELPGLEVDGIFTHFSSADEPERRPTEQQLDRFDALLDELAARGIRPPRVHAANSAAALRFRRAARLLVRPGIVVYGSAEEIAADSDGDEGPLPPGTFAPALSWHARVVQVRELAAGDSVSYNRRYVADRPERIAVLSVGYGDGWPYTLSNRGQVLLRGRPARIRGSICMDVTMVDATPFPDLAPGEVATLIGRQGAARQTVASVGEAAGLTSYAVLTGIGPRVERRYSDAEGEVSRP